AFGMESASQKVTELMRKGVDVSNYAPIIKAAHSFGITCSICVIVGFPGERWIDFLKTAVAIFRFAPFVNLLNLSMLSLGEIGKHPEEMERLGIRNDTIEVDQWRTKDGHNTPRVRIIRFRILKSIWYFRKKKELSNSWIYRPGPIFARLMRKRLSYGT